MRETTANKETTDKVNIKLSDKQEKTGSKLMTTRKVILAETYECKKQINSADGT